MTDQSKSPVRILSNGHGRKTEIQLDDGTIIQGVTSAVIFLDANDLTTVSIDIVSPDVDVLAYIADISWTCPACNEQVTHQCNPNPTMSGA